MGQPAERIVRRLRAALKEPVPKPAAAGPAVTFHLYPATLIFPVDEPFEVGITTSETGAEPADIYFYITIRGQQWFFDGAAGMWMSARHPALLLAASGGHAQAFPLFSQPQMWPVELLEAVPAIYTIGGSVERRADGGIIGAAYSAAALLTRRARLFTGNFDGGRPRQEKAEPPAVDHPLNNPAVWAFPESHCGFYLSPGCDPTVENDVVIQLQAANGQFSGESPWPERQFQRTGYAQNDDWFYFRRDLTGSNALPLTVRLRFACGGYRSWWLGPQQGAGERTPFWYLYDQERFRPMFRTLDHPGGNVVHGWRPWPRAGAVELGGFQRTFRLEPQDLPPDKHGRQPGCLEIAQSLPPPLFTEADLQQLLLNVLIPRAEAGGIRAAGKLITLAPHSGIVYPEHDPAGGRPIQAMLLWNGAGSAADGQRRASAMLPDLPIIVIAGGTHLEPTTPPMVLGAAVILADKLAYLLNSYSFVFIPHLNPDAFRWGTCQCWPSHGIDSNGWWEPSFDTTPQGAAVRASLLALENGNRARITGLLNLHNDLLPWLERRVRWGKPPPPVYGIIEADAAALPACDTFVDALRWLQSQTAHYAEWGISYGIQPGYSQPFVRDGQDRAVLKRDGRIEAAWKRSELRYGLGCFAAAKWHLLLEYPQQRYAFDRPAADVSGGVWECNRTYSYGAPFVPDPAAGQFLDPYLWGIEIMLALAATLLYQ